MTTTPTEILQALADGVNPVTGEHLPEDHLCQHPRVIRALYAALIALQKQEKYTERKKSLPAKTGAAWSDEEDADLLQAYDGGVSIAEIARSMERTRGAIEARLLRLGRKVPTQSVRHPWWPGRHLQEPQNTVGEGEKN